MAKMKSTINMTFAEQVIGVKAETAMRAVMVEASGDYVRILSQPGDGITYKRKSSTHTASSAGNPPAPDTGRLRQAGQTEVIRVTGAVVGVVSANTEYAAPLEFGTERIKPRPFMSRLIRENAAKYSEIFRRFLK